MVIRGTVQNGHIYIENACLPDGTRVLITPIMSPAGDEVPTSFQLQEFKEAVNRIAEAPCDSDLDDEFSGADHDKLLYGD